jgi:pilus assembly protein CpaE
MSAWKPLVICPVSETAQRMRAALSEAGFGEPLLLGAYPKPGAIAELSAKHGRNLCIVDLAADQEQALAAIADAARVATVVALDDGRDADLILRALRRGAREFLAEPSTAQARALAERLDATRAGAAAAPAGRHYCVAPGKPGCGASTVAVQLAAEERASGGSVLLVDADPLTAGIGFLLKLKSERHFGDVLRDWKRMDEDLWRRLVTSWRGIDVILAPEDPAARCAAGPEIAAELAAYWRKRYDVTIVDAPDVRAAVESGFAGAADDLLLVSTNELAPLHATRRALELREKIAPRVRVRLVLNRHDPSLGLKRADVRLALGTEPFATLSNDYGELQAAVLEGKPADGGSRFAADLRALARALRGEPAPPPKTGWLRRFSRRN